MRKLFKILLYILIALPVLFIIDYAIFDFGCLMFCDYKSIGDGTINLSGEYDLLKVAKLAEQHGISADIKYISTGPQLVLKTNHFGAEYSVLLRYSQVGSDKVYIDHFNVDGKAACLTPNLWVRLFIWKMFNDSGLETGWMWHVLINRVMYWPFFIG